MIPELTLGAQLADLSLTPELPDLADISAMGVGNINDCDAVDGPDDDDQVNRNHNCCSTCYEDQENDSDEDEINSDQTIESCHCGSCSHCELRQRVVSDSADFPNSLLVEDPSFMHKILDLSNEINESSPFREDDDYRPLENNGDYVEFYKNNLKFQSDLDDQGLGVEPEVSLLSTTSTSLSLTTANIHSLERQDHDIHGSTSEMGEDHLDYSVESAQDALGSNYSCRSYPTYDGCMSPSIGSESDSGRYSMLPPTAVSMTTIKTSTPAVAIASSKMGLSMNRSDSMKSNSSTSCEPLPYVAINEVQTANSSEAPAKLITSRHKITVLKAHTQETYSPATSFHAVPLTRGRGHTLPQISQKQRTDGVQSLQRAGGVFPHSRHFAFCPSIPEGNVTVDVNNYLDVRASSNITKQQKTRMHPRQPITNTPRSLYLYHQKKELLQQQLREKQERQMMDRDIVYQPAAFANDVGVPLQPTPTFVGFQSCNRHGHQTLLHDKNLQHKQLLSNNQQYMCHPVMPNFYNDSSPTSTNIPCNLANCPLGSNCNYQPDLSPTSPGPSYSYNMDAGSYNRVSQQQISGSFNNQVSLSQLEQYKAQLNSDVDYVIYPMKDPAISRQEYMDAKQSQVIANQTQQQQLQQIQYQRQHSSSCSNRQLVPPYKSPKLNPLYRSTPNVAGQMGSGILSSYPSYQSLASHNSMHQPGSSSGYSSMARGRYYSQQSLASSLSSTPSGYSASTHSLSGSYDPYGEIVMTATPSNVMRVRSDESILSSTLEDSEGISVTSAPPHHRPPPPYRAKVTMKNKYVQEHRA